MKNTIKTPEALLLISKYASELYRAEGELIDTQADDIIPVIYKHAKLTKNRNLILLYLHLRAEVHSSIEISLNSNSTTPLNKNSQEAPEVTQALN